MHQKSFTPRHSWEPNMVTTPLVCVPVFLTTPKMKGLGLHRSGQS